MNTPEILAMCNANGAVPGTKNAVNQSQLYRENGPLHLFVEQILNGASVPRPKTPAYPVITNEFQKAFQNIRNNGDVEEALTRASLRIDQDIQDDILVKLIDKNCPEAYGLLGPMRNPETDGVVSVNYAGNFVFRPASDFVGIYKFTFRVCFEFVSPYPGPFDDICQPSDIVSDYFTATITVEGSSSRLNKTGHHQSKRTP